MVILFIFWTIFTLHLIIIYEMRDSLSQLHPYGYRSGTIIITVIHGTHPVAATKVIELILSLNISPIPSVFLLSLVVPSYPSPYSEPSPKGDAWRIKSPNWRMIRFQGFTGWVIIYLGHLCRIPRLSHRSRN